MHEGEDPEDAEIEAYQRWYGALPEDSKYKHGIAAGNANNWLGEVRNMGPRELIAAHRQWMAGAKDVERGLVEALEWALRKLGSTVNYAGGERWCQMCSNEITGLECRNPSCELVKVRAVLAAAKSADQGPGEAENADMAAERTTVDLLASSAEATKRRDESFLEAERKFLSDLQRRQADQPSPPSSIADQIEGWALMLIGACAYTGAPEPRPLPREYLFQLATDMRSAAASYRAEKAEPSIVSWPPQLRDWGMEIRHDDSGNVIERTFRWWPTGAMEPEVWVARRGPTMEDMLDEMHALGWELIEAEDSRAAEPCRRYRFIRYLHGRNVLVANGVSAVTYVKAEAPTHREAVAECLKKIREREATK